MRTPRRTTLRAATVGALLALPPLLGAQPAARRPLGAAEIDDLARLVMLEDRRALDDTALARLLAAPHPEVRRRAAIAVARIADRRGVALLRARPLDADTAVAATTVFAVGQLRDTATVPWLDSVLSSPRAAPTVLAEAAAGLGKIKTADARAALARFLAAATATPRTRDAIGEALLAIGRATARGDLAPIVRWTRSADEELRWRATWGLFRPRDPASVSPLLALADDPSAHVRSWALRGLTRPQVDSAGGDLAARAEARLVAATRDADRRVRTEALRSLGTYTDAAAAAALTAALASPDTWLSVTAAEGLGRVASPEAARALAAAAGPDRPCALRATALQALQALQAVAAAEALMVATHLTRDTVAYCRATALQALARAAGSAPVGEPARAAIDGLLADPAPAVRLQARQAWWAARDAGLAPDARRAARRTELAAADATARAGALRAMAAWADTTDLPWLLDQYERARGDATTAAASAAIAAVAAVQRRQGQGAAAFVGRFPPPEDRALRREADRAFDAAARRAWPAASPGARTLADYRRLVERWVVPDYDGRPRPRAVWETPRGAIELELYPGDAPMATDDFVRAVESGAIVGTEFTRVVPDFVNQQAPIAGGTVLRDEVNRHRLTRGNLAWATAGLDTGIPGYTLGHTPQPHNEGDFTSLGRVVRGMDAADRVELGDRVTAARMARR
jgi:cyclophilin family peptidyl-prolyl cis-trans isomerase/HEAT repeat protein